jgi:hypothetical protein
MRRRIVNSFAAMACILSIVDLIPAFFFHGSLVHRGERNKNRKEKKGHWHHHHSHNISRSISGTQTGSKRGITA